MRLCRHRSGLAAFLAIAIAWAPHIAAQVWPDKPIRLIVNFGPGGAPDLIARLIAPRLAEVLGQPVIVDNRAGAGGNIGVEAVARALPDGYTLLSSASSSFVIGPHLYKQGFDPVKDVTPVAPAALTPMYLVVRANFPAKTVAELVAYARTHAGKLNYGSAGSGTLPHIAAEMLLRMANIQAVHVPFKGSGAALAALLGDQVDFVFDPGVAIPQVKAGKARLLAVGSASRSPSAPDTPTVREAGIDMTAVSIVGLYAPAGTPADIVLRLNREITRIMRTPEVSAALTTMAAEPLTASPEEFSLMLARDRERFGVIVREANIRVD